MLDDKSKGEQSGTDSEQCGEDFVEEEEPLSPAMLSQSEEVQLLEASDQISISKSDGDEVSCENRSTPLTTWEKLKQLVPIIKVFIPLIMFWAVYYQRSSTWVVQATQMDCYVGSLHIPPG